MEFCMHSLRTRSYHYEMQGDYGTLISVIQTVYVLVYCTLPHPLKIFLKMSTFCTTQKHFSHTQKQCVLYAS
jgi:hypothetical protein